MNRPRGHELLPLYVSVWHWEQAQLKQEAWEPRLRPLAWVREVGCTDGPPPQPTTAPAPTVPRKIVLRESCGGSGRGPAEDPAPTAPTYLRKAFCGGLWGPARSRHFA